MNRESFPSPCPPPASGERHKSTRCHLDHSSLSLRLHVPDPLRLARPSAVPAGIRGQSRRVLRPPERPGRILARRCPHLRRPRPGAGRHVAGTLALRPDSGSHQLSRASEDRKDAALAGRADRAIPARRRHAARLPPPSGAIGRRIRPFQPDRRRRCRPLVLLQPHRVERIATALPRAGDRRVPA